MTRPLPINRDEYEVVRAPVVDAFSYVGTDPETGAALNISLNEAFLNKSARVMNQKCLESGDLSPIVIGHTKKGLKETEQPPVVGYLHNFAVEPFEGTKALFADHYIRKQNRLAIDGVLGDWTAKQIVERFPRRSGEIHLSTGEVDPHSLLGATTPHRSLGLLKLSADGSAAFGYESPGALKMPDATNPTPEGGKTGDMEELKALIKQQSAMIGQVLETLTAALQPHQPGTEQPHDGGDGDIDQWLAGLESDGGGKKPEPKAEEKPEAKPEPKEEAKPEPKAEEKPEPKEDEEKVKLARERDELVLKLARTEVTSRLTTLKLQGVSVDPADEQLVTDLMALPPDMRERQIARLQRGMVALPARGGVPTGLDAAVAQATGGNGKKITDTATLQKITLQAQSRGVSFEQVCREQGYALPGQ